MIPCIIITILTIAYLSVSIWQSKSIPESISATSYIWEDGCNHKSTHKAYLFSLYCAIITCLIFLPWLQKISCYNANFEFLSFLGCVGIMGAAVTPFFKESFQGIIHYSSGALISLTWFGTIIITHAWVLLGIGFGIFIILTLIHKNAWVLWLELIGLGTLLYLCW